MAESQVQSRKQSKLLYTRDFLLSFCELDICKKLPVGFDASVLSEFAVASQNMPERQRIHGGLSLQRYGSTLLNRVDNSSNYVRGSHGRWDTRSSGSNDRDGDSSSDHDSVSQDSGKRYGNYSRCTWKHPEHDGLLGSGAFPRPSGYSGGASAPRALGNDHYQLSRSSEPYLPPCFYKTHSRQDTTDSRNDETFGSAECSSEDRAEEERKRRASFELMRKEQQKALQEKQKLSNKNKEQLGSDIVVPSENYENEKDLWCQGDGKLEDHVHVASVSKGDSLKCYFPPQASPSRPFVPPGFANAGLEKNLGAKSPVSIPEHEVANIGFEDNAHSKPSLSGSDQETGNQSASVLSHGEICEIKSVGVSFMDANARTLISSSDDEAFKCSFSSENPSFKSSSLLEASGGSVDDAVANSDDEKVTGFKVGIVGQGQSTSILEKLFNNALPVNSVGTPSFEKHIDAQSEGNAWGTQSWQASKFAHWFEEERKPVDDVASSQTGDLLSLIVSNDKGGSQASTVSDDRAVKNIPRFLPCENNKVAEIKTSFPETSIVVGIDPFYHCEKSDVCAGILTCEDLEQSILAEVKENGSPVQHSMQQAWNLVDVELKLQKADVGNHASQHLLSLLRKGKNLEGPTTSNVNMCSSEKQGVHGDVNGIAENVPNTGKALTLEALFGNAFMKELHSVEAPVSVHRVSTSVDGKTDVSEPQGLPFSFLGDGFFNSTDNKHASNKPNLIQEPQPHKTQGDCLSFNEIQSRGSKLEADGHFEGKDDGVLDIGLPEEESLISIGDPLHLEISQVMPVSISARTDDFISSVPPVDIVDKLATLNVILKDEKSMAPHLKRLSDLHNPYEQWEPDVSYQHLHVRPPLEFPHQMNETRPPFHLFEQLAGRSHQTEFIGPENIHHDLQHAFQPNVLHPIHGLGGPMFHSAHHSALHHMPMPGNFPPPHMLHGLPRGVPFPHPFNHLPGYTPEMSPIQGFPLNHQRASYNGVGMGLPGSGLGSGSQLEALERLIEMELRGNQKKTASIAAGHGLGIYGSELDMAFRYR